MDGTDKFTAAERQSQDEKNRIAVQTPIDWGVGTKASPLDYSKTTKDGKLGDLDFSNLTEDQRLNLKDIKVQRTAFGETIAVKVVDQQRAVEMIAKHLGLLVEKLPHTGAFDPTRTFNSTGDSGRRPGARNNDGELSSHQVLVG